MRGREDDMLMSLLVPGQFFFQGVLLALESIKNLLEMPWCIML